MGSIAYDGTVIQFEDRVLTHLQIVIVQKFTKNESFLMSWKDSNAVGDGRGSIWLSPSLPLYFKFLGSKVPNVNREWLLELGKSADSSTGLIVTEESGQLAQANDAGPSRYPGDTSA
ncbi:MAG TPA: ATP-dependent DNA ligase [Rhodoglobus sp.]|nr:ATP-dependent DNA ligase [Rhodoglobus sp.]